MYFLARPNSVSFAVQTAPKALAISCDRRCSSKQHEIDQLKQYLKYFIKLKIFIAIGNDDY